MTVHDAYDHLKHVGSEIGQKISDKYHSIRNSLDNPDINGRTHSQHQEILNNIAKQKFIDKKVGLGDFSARVSNDIDQTTGKLHSNLKINRDYSVKTVPDWRYNNYKPGDFLRSQYSPFDNVSHAPK